MKAVADTLAIARSNLIERRMTCPAKPRGSYRKAGDEPLVALIRRPVDERPTYGYWRITPLLNRQQKGRKQAQYQCQAGAADHAGQSTDPGTAHRAPARTHTRRRGARPALQCPLVLRSLRAFLPQRRDCPRAAIDACDQEIIAWSATTAGISGEMVRDRWSPVSSVGSGSARPCMPSNGCPITAQLTSPRTRSTPRQPLACSYASRRSVRRNRTALRRAS